AHRTRGASWTRCSLSPSRASRSLSSPRNAPWPRLPDRPRLVIASGNQGKLREYRDLLAAAGLELIAFDTEVDEVGDSYADNARPKAQAAVSNSGRPALGRDSGLEADAPRGPTG